MFFELIAEELHVCRIPAENKIHAGSAVEVRSTVALPLATNRMIYRDMHRAEDADALGHGSDGSRPGERLHQVAAVVIVTAGSRLNPPVAAFVNHSCL
jgi:hypothetical protein